MRSRIPTLVLCCLLAVSCGHSSSPSSPSVGLPGAGSSPISSGASIAGTVVTSVTANAYKAEATGLTVSVTERLHVRHPPAGATTIIFALGVLQQPIAFVAVGCGATITAYGACFVQFVTGREFPVWRPLDEVAARAARAASGGAEGAGGPA